MLQAIVAKIHLLEIKSTLKLDENSVLYIKSIDRLGRSYRDLSDQWQLITKDKGSDVVVIDICFGNLRVALATLGTPIGAYDVMIGAQGLTKGLTVVTHNTSEFSRIPGLKLEDWV